MDEIRELILKSLSEDLNQTEKEKLGNALNNSEDLRKEMADYEKISNSLSGSDFAFNEGFSDRVMHKLKNSQIDLWGSFKSVALSSVAAIAILLISIYFIDGSLNLDSLFGLQGYSVEDEFYSLLNN